MPKKRLDGTRFDGYWMDPGAIVIVGLDVPASDELAHLYDPRVEDEVDHKMVANIMVYGVAEPVIVTNIDGTPHVVDGRGRVRAARLANERLAAEGKETLRVPVILRRGADHELFGVMISSNEIRRDDNIMVKATKVQRFLNMGRTTQEVANAFGVSEVSIANWARMLELAKPVQKLVEQGKLSANAASKLHGLPAEEQTKKALELVRAEKATGKKATAKQAREAVTGRPAAPGKKLVKKILRVEDENPGAVSPKIKTEHNNFFSALRYLIGDLSAEEVGLNVDAIEDEVKRMRKIEKEVKAANRKAEKAAEAAEKAKEEAQAAEAKKRADDAMKRGVVIKKKRSAA